MYRNAIANITEPSHTDISEVIIMEELNVSQLLVFKKPEEEGPLVRGGHADALVVHATNAVKNGMNFDLGLCYNVYLSHTLLSFIYF